MKSRTMAAILATVFVAFSSSVLAAPVSLPKTGQTKCYNTNGMERACTNTGEDGDKQAGVPWPSPRFTVNANTIVDNLTGLEWLKDANCLNTKHASFDSLDDKVDGNVFWSRGMNFVKLINNGTYADCGDGKSDWHLPNVNEMASLMNYNQDESSVSWLGKQGFQNVLTTYYTSTTSSMAAGSAWTVNLSSNNIDVGEKEYASNGVWPVRGISTKLPRTGQTLCYSQTLSADQIPCTGTKQDGDLQAGVALPSPRLTENSNKTITDNLTGLVWLKDANCAATYYSPEFSSYGYMTWQQALDFVTELNKGSNGKYPLCGAGATDWRLPNAIELRSIINYSLAEPPVAESSKIQNISVNWYENYLTSTTSPNSNQVFVIVADSGKQTQFMKDGTSNNFLLWPVRGGAVAAIKGEPLLLDFGQEPNNVQSSELATTIKNNGGDTINITNMSLSNSTNFILNVNGGSLPCGATSKALGPGQFCTVGVAFKPTAVQAYNETLTIASSDPVKPALAISLSGTGIACNYSVSPTSQSTTSAGGNYTANVNASPANCPWTASSPVTWATITQGATGTGNGTVSYTVGANSETTARNTQLSIATQTLTVNQEGAPSVCQTMSISPTSKNAPSTASTGSVSVTAANGCGWNAVSNVSWITISSGTSGTGNGTVNFAVTANSDFSPRTGTLSIAGKTFTVTQAAASQCTFTVSPTSGSIASKGGSVSFSITPSATDCTWSAEGNEWLSFTPANGTGKAKIKMTAKATTSSLQRTATVSVANQPVTINQAGGTCKTTISPKSSTFTSAGGPGLLNIQTSLTDCAWSASATVPWIHLTGLTNGSGNDTVPFNVDQGTGAARSGKINVLQDTKNTAFSVKQSK